jgi:hypothetical protein
MKFQKQFFFVLKKGRKKKFEPIATTKSFSHRHR